MQTSISNLIFLACIYAIFQWSCAKPLEVDSCQAYLSDTFLAIDPIEQEIYPGYNIPRFSAEVDDTYYFIKRKRESSSIIRRRIDKGGSKTVFSSEMIIQTFDQNSSGQIVFAHKGALYILEKNDSQTTEIVLESHVSHVRWNGEKLICRIDAENLIEVDLDGNVLNQWNFPGRTIDHWSRDSVLVVTHLDSIKAFHIPSLTQQWSLPIHIYSEDLGNITYETQHKISITGKYDGTNGLTQIFFSTPKEILSYDLASNTVTTLWHQQDCMLLESGLSLSKDENYLITGISRGYENHNKRYGLLTLNLANNSWEVVAPW